MRSQAVARPIRERSTVVRSSVKAGKAPIPSARKMKSLIAEETGLLDGRRTLMVRGRMPEALVAQAKLKTGIDSDSKLLEAALVNLAVADDYAEWLFSQRGSISADIDLEF